jgi:hypothetical protein
MLDRAGDRNGSAELPEEDGFGAQGTTRKPAMATAGGKRTDMDDEIPF